MILEVDTTSTRPIYEQLRDQIILGIASNQLAPGEALPSVRRLAADLGINLHTVGKSYAVLVDEGYIVMDRRKGATVNQAVTNSPAHEASFSYRLQLLAAEAKCRHVHEEQFLQLCRDCYRKNEQTDEADT